MSENVSPGGSGEPPPLDPLKDEVASDYALGATVRQLMCKHQVTERTIYRWLAEPLVRARVEEIRGASFGATVGLLTRDLRTARNVLHELATDPARDDRLRKAAADSLGELSLRGQMLERYEKRLKAVEDRLGLDKLQGKGA